MRSTPENLYEDDYWIVRQPFERRVTLTRTATPFESVHAIRRSMAALFEVLQPMQHSKNQALVDLRQARGRNDPEFEEGFAVWRKRIYVGWGRVVALCASEVGRMHVERHMRQDGADWQVVTDEEEALRLLDAGA